MYLKEKFVVAKLAWLPGLSALSSDKSLINVFYQIVIFEFKSLWSQKFACYIKM
jgi:hypothetical protein